MDGEDYLTKLDLNNELDKIIAKSLKMYQETDGEKCKVCGIVQGVAFKGVSKYYCEHITQRIDSKLRKWKQKVTTKIFGAVAKQKLKEVQKRDL